MEILNIMRKQRDILNELEDILIQEKQVLIDNDARTLTILIEKKNVLMKDLEEIEEKRQSTYGNQTISEMVIAKAYQQEVKAIAHEIKDLHEAIGKYQETNLLLTQQAMDYNNAMIYIIKQAVSKAGSIYGENGKVEGSNKLKTSLDKSV